MIKLLEPRIDIMCLEHDVGLINSLKSECQEEFA